jgi:hypothetical protein
MARWGVWTASAIGAAAAGAAVALLRRRRPDAEGTADAPEAAAAEPPAAGAAEPPPAEDPQEALDAARDRLRARADALRDQIEGEGEEPPPEG